MYATINLQQATIRHARFYYQKLNTANEHYFEDTTAIVEELKLALPQIRHAVNWLMDHHETLPDTAEVLIDILIASKPALWLLVSPREWESWLQTGLETSYAQQNAHIEMQLRYFIGGVHFNRHDIASAKMQLETAVEIGEAIQATELLGLIYYDLAIVYQNLPDNDKRQAAINAAHHYFQQQGDDKGLAKVKHHMAEQAMRRLDYDAALQISRELIPLWERTNQWFFLGQQHYLISVIYNNRTQFDQAVEHARQALTVFEKIHEQRSVAAALHVLCSAHYELGNLDEALSFNQQAYDIAQAQESYETWCRLQLMFGQIHQKKSEMLLAQDYYQLAIETATRIDDRETLVEAHRLLGLVLLHQGYIDSARQHILTTYDLIKTLDNSIWEMGVLASFILLLLHEGSTTLAHEIYAYLATQPELTIVHHELEQAPEIRILKDLPPIAPPTHEDIRYLLASHYNLFPPTSNAR